ncbi:hypothetical protein ACJX0J_013937, partial [Zea mays]
FLTKKPMLTYLQRSLWHNDGNNRYCLPLDESHHLAVTLVAEIVSWKMTDQIRGYNDVGCTSWYCDLGTYVNLFLDYLVNLFAFLYLGYMHSAYQVHFAVLWHCAHFMALYQIASTA